MKYTVPLIILIFFTACSSPSNTFKKNGVFTDKDSIIDDFSNRNNIQDYEMLRSYNQSQVQKEKIKVFYRDSVYTLGDFIKINKDKKLQDFEIIGDTMLTQKQ